MEENRTPSTATLILQLLGYVLAFAAPITVAALLMPAYAPGIVLGGIVLFFAVSSFLFGWEWDDPRWTRETRGYARGILFSVVSIPTIELAYDAITERSVEMRDLALAAGLVATFLTVLLVPFYLGRGMHRRRRFEDRTAGAMIERIP